MKLRIAFSGQNLLLPQSAVLVDNCYLEEAKLDGVNVIAAF